MVYVTSVVQLSDHHNDAQGLSVVSSAAFELASLFMPSSLTCALTSLFMPSLGTCTLTSLFTHPSGTHMQAYAPGRHRQPAASPWDAACLLRPCMSPCCSSSMARTAPLAGCAHACCGAEQPRHWWMRPAQHTASHAFMRHIHACGVCMTACLVYDSPPFYCGTQPA